LRRIPTPLLVTLVGLALSAWLLPAITRQWDDRQKAHQLKAALVSEMATATAGALTETHDLMLKSSSDTLDLGKHRLVFAEWRATPPAKKEWARSSIRIEAKLRAYFGSREAQEWRNYRHVVDRFLARVAGLPFGPQADSNPAPLSGELAKLNTEAFDVRSWRDQIIQILGQELRSGQPMFQSILAPMISVASLQDRLLRYEENFGREVIAQHVDGYSTTMGDLFHDLIP
jgi:hypothetical protein